MNINKNLPFCGVGGRGSGCGAGGGVGVLGAPSFAGDEGALDGVGLAGRSGCPTSPENNGSFAITKRKNKKMIDFK